MASKFKKFWIGVKETVLILLGIVAGLLLPLLIAAGYGIWWLNNASQLDMGRDKFNREVWLQGPSEHRCHMYKDLVKKRLKIGMTQEQVKELLGVPFSEYYSASGDYKGISYYLGNCSFNLIEGHKYSWSLKIILDKTQGIKFIYNDHEENLPEVVAFNFGAFCFMEDKDCSCSGVEEKTVGQDGSVTISIKEYGQDNVPIEDIDNICGVKSW